MTLSAAIPKNESVEISGLLYKRRGGFGRMMPNAWQQRIFFISKQGYISYYDSENPESIVDAKPRGKLDLSSATYDFTLDGISDGAPSQYIIYIIPPNEEKWKLCISNEIDFQAWKKVIKNYASAASPSKLENINNNTSSEVFGPV